MTYEFDKTYENPKTSLKLRLKFQDIIGVCLNQVGSDLQAYTSSSHPYIYYSGVFEDGSLPDFFLLIHKRLMNRHADIYIVDSDSNNSAHVLGRTIRTSRGYYPKALDKHTKWVTTDLGSQHKVGVASMSEVEIQQLQTLVDTALTELVEIDALGPLDPRKFGSREYALNSVSGEVGTFVVLKNSSVQPCAELSNILGDWDLL